MNAARPRPLIETYAGNGGGDLLRFGYGRDQAGAISVYRGFSISIGANIRRFHVVVMSDVDGVAPFVAPQSVHRFGNDFAHHHAGEAARLEGFVEKSPGLNRAESEAYKCTLTGK